MRQTNSMRVESAKDPPCDSPSCPIVVRRPSSAGRSLSDPTDCPHRCLDGDLTGLREYAAKASVIGAVAMWWRVLRHHLRVDQGGRAVQPARAAQGRPEAPPAQCDEIGEGHVRSTGAKARLILRAGQCRHPACARHETAERMPLWIFPFGWIR